MSTCAETETSVNVPGASLSTGGVGGAGGSQTPTIGCRKPLPKWYIWSSENGAGLNGCAMALMVLRNGLVGPGTKPASTPAAGPGDSRNFQSAPALSELTELVGMNRPISVMPS